MSSVAKAETFDRLDVKELIESPRLTKLVDLTRVPRKGGLQDLLHVAFEALQFFPPLYVQSIFGPVRSWLPPHREHSEFTIIDLWHALRTVRFLTKVSVPAVPEEPPDLLRMLIPPVVNEIFWRPTAFYEQPDLYGGSHVYPGEWWFYVNGVATDSAVARMNSALLTELFHRPMTVIQNASCSLGLDLVECAVGKGFKTDPDLEDGGTFTEAALKATLAVIEALNQPRIGKVVVVAHSQGTIIAANVLRAIIKALNEKRLSKKAATRQAEDVVETFTAQAENPRVVELRNALSAVLAQFLDSEENALHRVKKLEIYTFANCADKMKYAFEENGVRYPHMEHFANERDLVARLGVLAPCREDKDCDRIDIEGPVYVKKGRGVFKRNAWGHFLNEHYLFDIADHLNAPDGKKGNPYLPVGEAPEVPRLYRYFDGQKPD